MEEQNGPGVGGAEAVKPLGRFLAGMGALGAGVFRGARKAQHRRPVRFVRNASGRPSQATRPSC
jgi:hypothetical protein